MAATFELIDLLKRIGDLDRARSLTAALGFLDGFMLVGAFDNDQGKAFRTAYPPEAQIDLDAELPAMLVPARWRPAALVSDDGLIRVGEQITPARWAAAYLVTYVQSDRDVECELRLTTSASVTAWVNDRLVVAEEHVDALAPDNVIASIRLREGWNKLLIKSANDDSAGWRLGARITDSGGVTLSTIPAAASGTFITSPRPHSYAPDVDPGGQQAEAPRARFFPSSLDSVEPPVRRHLLALRAYTRAGQNRRALDPARALLAALPEHPLAVYEAAMAHWYADELGRAIDLLNDGVTRSGEWAAAFLRQRARFYGQRDLWDKALDDLLDAAERSPDGRIVRMDLADAFDQRGWQIDRCRTLEEALATWPDSGWAMRTLGDCLAERGYGEQAEARYREAHALEPGSPWTIERLAALATARHRWREAIRWREALRTLEPTSGAYLVAAADAYRQADRRDEARALYELAAERDPAWSGPFYRLGEMAYEDGARDDALAAWDRALERNPDDGELAERIDFQRQGRAGGVRRYMPDDEQIAAAIARAEGMRIDPGAHTVYLLDHEVTTVRHDGSARRYVTLVALAVTTEGRDDLIATRVPTEARILSAWSRGPDGARQEASSIRDGTVRFRRLDAGSIVVLQYIHYEPPPHFLPTHYTGSWWFQGIHRQVVEARWVLMLPPGRELATRITGEVAHAQREADGYLVHEFSAENVPPVRAEPLMPPAGDVLRRVAVSTLTSWDEYVHWEQALLSEVFHSNEELRALATRLVDGVTGTRERLDRLFHYVAEEIRYQQDYETTIAGVRPHSCPIVLERGYGDCKDKAVLLIMLAREVGIDVDFAILRTTDAGEVDREVPNQQFNHAIAYVPAQDGIAEGFFLDPTTDGLEVGNLRSDDQGALSLVVDPESGAHRFLPIPYDAADREFFRAEVDVDIAPAGTAAARAVLTLRGGGSAAARRILRNPEQARSLYQSLANQLFAGATVSESEPRHHDDIWEPLEIRLGMDVSPAVQPHAGQHRITVPMIFPLAGATRLDTRQTPMRLGPPETVSIAVRYRLPPRARVIEPPAPVELEHACVRVHQTVDVAGREVTVRMSYQRTCPTVAIADYPELRRVVQQAANQLRGQLVFELPRR